MEIEYRIYQHLMKLMLAYGTLILWSKLEYRLALKRFLAQCYGCHGETTKH